MGSSSILAQAFVLLAVFQVKHYVADFPLQSQYMLRKTEPGWSFAGPLALHCAVHAGLCLAIVIVVAPSLWWLAVVDFVTHFAMDRIKSGPRYLGRYRDVSRTGFWNCLGFDQMVHHLTGFYIIWMLVTHAPS